MVDDAADDADGDGKSNLDEYLDDTDVNADSVAPVITLPVDVSVSSSGYLTKVDIGKATAIDIKDGVVSVSADKSGPFITGRHSITWTATDAAGNSAEAYQTVDVLPRVNFGINQRR